MKKYRSAFVVTVMFLGLLTACGGGSSGGDDNEGGTVPSTGGDYVIFAWNDLGMHCLNPTYDTAVILPPYNTVWAQVVRRGSPPEVVTAGVALEYRIVSNTSSADKAWRRARG